MSPPAVANASVPCITLSSDSSFNTSREGEDQANATLMQDTTILQAGAIIGSTIQSTMPGSRDEEEKNTCNTQLRLGEERVDSDDEEDDLQKLGRRRREVRSVWYGAVLDKSFSRKKEEIGKLKVMFNDLLANIKVFEEKNEVKENPKPAQDHDRVTNNAVATKKKIIVSKKN